MAKDGDEREGLKCEDDDNYAVKKRYYDSLQSVWGT